MVFSIAVDAIHALKSDSDKIVSTERHYYTDNGLFEQSIDIYRPTPVAAQISSSSQPLPVVTLVVGSAWLGHRSIIYSGCSWWNAAGPKQVAELGCTCVCIRHRGAFPRTFSPLTLLFVTIKALMLLTLLDWFIGNDGWAAVEEIIAIHFPTQQALSAVPLGRTSAFILTVLFGLLLIQVAGMGSASFDQMQNDVMDAIAYLEKNKKRLGLNFSSASATKGSNENVSPFVFGGYSSGGHVAATVTQQPHLWKERNLPPPDLYCASLLFLSPVLSTKPYTEICRKISSSSLSMISPSSSMPSLAPSENFQANDQNIEDKALDRSSSTMSSSTISSLQSTNSPPTWLTSELVKAIFGHAAAQSTPSPIHTYHKSPSVPHTFIRCRNEMFGLNWLDVFFASPAYCELLKSVGIESRHIAVESDHWNILNSTVLREALEKEIQIILTRQ